MGFTTRIRSALGLEQRAQYYSPGVEDALFNAALKGRSDVSQTAAATAAIRAISDPFAVANVTPIALASVLSPSVLVDMARRVLLTGNAVYLLDVDAIGGMSLVPASSFEVTGGYRPDSWVYRLSLPRPGGEPVTKTKTSDGVVHVKVGPTTIEPWRGVSPLRECGLTSEALAYLDRSLGMDAKPPAGLLMALPDGATQERRWTWLLRPFRQVKEVLALSRPRPTATALASKLHRLDPLRTTDKSGTARSYRKGTCTRTSYSVAVCSMHSA